MEFEQVYDLYFQDVYRYILKLSGSEHIAEEVTSETFFKALHSIGKFRGQCDIRVWLCQIARNSYRPGPDAAVHGGHAQRRERLLCQGASGDL